MTSGETMPPAGVPPTAADDVRDAHARWWNALLDEDVAVLDTLLADDLTFHGPSGGTTTKAAYLDRLRSGRLAYDSVAAAEPLVRVHGVTAIVTGRRHPLSVGGPAEDGGPVLHGGVRVDRPTVAHARLAVDDPRRCALTQALSGSPTAVSRPTG